MKERGIIFNGDMVRAILDGRKTQTRRQVKASTADMLDLQEKYPHKKYNIDCLLGVVGDRLYVREAFATLSYDGYEPEKPSLTGSCQEVRYRATDRLAGLDAETRGYSWRPSIHMPHWASRILLEITDVRVERLNDISEADALAEGFASTTQLTALGDDYTGLYASDRFADTWSAIYGAESWNANPWVWVIEFKQIK